MRWNVCGADAVAVRNGGEPLNVGVEQLRQCRRLGVAQLRELLGDRLHGAVVLAQLGAGGDGIDRRRVALGGECGRQIFRVAAGLHPGADPLGQLGSPPAGELADRLLAAVLGQ